jgi:AraC-like DNA-binding protein
MPGIQGTESRTSRGHRPFGAPPEGYGARIVVHSSPWFPGHVPNVLLLTSTCERPKIDGMTPSALHIFFGRRGRVAISVRGQRFEVAAGSAFILQPYETYELEKDGADFDAGGALVLNETLLDAALARVAHTTARDVSWLNPGVAACGYARLGSAAVRFARRMVDAVCPDQVADAMADFLVACARDGAPDLVIRRNPPPMPPVVEHIRAIVEEEMPGRLLLADIAAAHGTTPSHLIRVFRRATGVTPQQYLNGRRSICLLYQLLQLENLADAAAVTNYSDQSHMTRDLKARTGLRPGVLRRLVKLRL